MLAAGVYSSPVNTRYPNQAARNRLIQRILASLWDDLGRFGVTTFAYPRRKQQAVVEHRAITDAIVGGREDDAERLARAHLAAGREVRLRLLHQGDALPSRDAEPPRGARRARRGVAGSEDADDAGRSGANSPAARRGGQRAESRGSRVGDAGRSLR